MNRLREFSHLSWGGSVITTLGVDLSDVRVGSGFVHVAIMGQNGGPVKGACDTFSTGLRMKNI